MEKGSELGWNPPLGRGLQLRTSPSGLNSLNRVGLRQCASEGFQEQDEIVAVRLRECGVMLTITAISKVGSRVTSAHLERWRGHLWVPGISAQQGQ